MTLSKIKGDIVIWVVLLIVYVLSRTLNLDAIPIFTDEAIYLHWSSVMANDASFRYLPLTDGKPPLYMWTTAFALKLLPNFDPLIIGRLVSGITGLFTLVGIFFSSYVLFRNRKISYLATLLYILNPFTFFYDRFGLADSMLAMWSLWSLGLAVLFVRNLRLDLAIILGIVIGLGLLTKTPAVFFLVLVLPLIVIFELKKPLSKKRILKLVGLLVLVAGLSRVIYSIIFLLPQAYVVSLKNQEFILPLSDFLRDPLQLFSGNLSALVKWELIYLTIPITFLVFVGLTFNWRQAIKAKLLLILCFLGYLLFLVFLNKIIYPRYLLTFTPYLLILAAVGLSEINLIVRHRVLFFALVAIFVAQSILTDYRLVTRPETAPIADVDSEQYLNSWPAGWGINNIRKFFQEESLKSPQITVGVEGTFGLLPYALDIYHREYPNLEIKSYWPEPTDIPRDIQLAAVSHPTYYIIYQREVTPKYNGTLELKAKFQQGSSNHFLKLYRVIPRE